MLVKITAPPGIVTEVTDYTAGPRWIGCDKIRFRYSFPEVIGGYSKLTIEGTTTVTGAPRTMKAWRELDGLQNLAVGTATNLYLFQGSIAYNITPLRSDDASLGTNAFAVANTSTTVTVTHSSHGAKNGDIVIFAGATTTAGVPAGELNAEHVITYVNANSYTITVTTAGTSTAAGGGTSITADYLINIGEEFATYGYGWGAATWGLSTWGTTRTTSQISLYSRIWSLDNWGEDLICTPGNGDETAYIWDSSAGTSTRPVAISNAPTKVNHLLVSESRHLVALGAHDGTAYDPMLIRWSSQEDNTAWTASATNTAGDKLLNTGNEIIAAKKARGHIIVLTDTAAWSMQYIGPPFTFGFQQIGDTCGGIGPQALATIDNLGFWMGDDNFYVFDGSTKAIPCPIANHIFDDFNRVSGRNVQAFTLKEFNEVWWHYPSADSQELDRYAIFNYKDNTWAFGTMERTAGIDRGTYSDPIWADASGNLYSHEKGLTADGGVLAAYLETGAFEVGQGDTLSYLDRLIPDTTLNSGRTVKATVYTRRYPNSSDITKGTYSVNSDTTKVSLRARGRQFRFRFENDDINNPWKLGVWRADIQPDGKR
tara:strand:+ start:526 stop:2316 length:1791 start_codon:yes stop_codon:yes gene_type:complete